MAKKYQNKVHLDWEGNPLRIHKEQGKDELIDVRTEEIFTIILNNAQMRTMNDSIQGNRLAVSMKKCKDGEFIEIEDGVYDWLKEQAQTICPPAFRINAGGIMEFILEGFEKSHQPKE